MNNSKVKSLFYSLFCLFALNIQAQITEDVRQNEIPREQRAKLTPEQRAQKVTDRMTERLGLNEKQAQQIYALNLESQQRRKEVTPETAQQVRTEQMAKYKSILNAEQYARFEKTAAKRMNKHRGQHGKKHGAKNNRTPEQKAQRKTDRMTETLNLNEKQVTEIQAINLVNAKKRADAEKRMHEKNQAEVMQEYKRVLTPEQYEQLEQKQAERKEKRKH